MLDIDAQQVFGYVIYKEGKYVRLPYPLNRSNSNVTGKSFHNGLFVQRLREKAASLPKYSLITVTLVKIAQITLLLHISVGRMVFLTSTLV